MTFVHTLSAAASASMLLASVSYIEHPSSTLTAPLISRRESEGGLLHGDATVVKGIAWDNSRSRDGHCLLLHDHFPPPRQLSVRPRCLWRSQNPRSLKKRQTFVSIHAPGHLVLFTRVLRWPNGFRLAFNRFRLYRPDSVARAKLSEPLGGVG